MGVTIDKHLSFSSHCSNVSKKAKVICNLILKSFVYQKSSVILMKAFNTYVKPILEYCTVVWNPFLIKDIKTIETVQRQFTKRILPNKTLSYTDRLTYLSAETLEQRRLIFDLSLMFSIIRCNIMPMNKIFVLNENSTRKYHPYTLKLQRYRSNIRKNDFSIRINHI